MDVSVLSFLFSGIIWYIWAFLWGQIYGKETTYGIEILYDNSFSSVPYEVPIFPLAIVYAFLFFVLFSVLYMIAMFINVRWVVGYMGLILIGSFFLIFENFSWKYDIFKTELGLNFNQLGALVLILFAIYGLYRIYKTPKSIDLI